MSLPKNKIFIRNDGQFEFIEPQESEEKWGQYASTAMVFLSFAVGMAIAYWAIWPAMKWLWRII
jgi:hypothetical protein